MRKIWLGVLSGALMCGVGAAYADDVLARDTSDPLYLQAIEEILSNTTLSFSDSVLRLGQSVSYGFNNRFSMGANVHYQNDFAGGEDGFSAIDVGGIYRLARAQDNDQRIITDVLAGLKFGGSSHVRTPYFADSTYYAGLRFGRQWTGFTLAATIKSSWIFDDTRGMSYIDFVPSAYFRVNPDWRLGAEFTWRKSTNPDYDQEWLDGKIVRQFGRTQYVGQIGYEFEGDDIQIGTRVNILF